MSKNHKKNGQNHKKTGEKQAILPKRPFKTGMPVLKRATSTHWEGEGRGRGKGEAKGVGREEGGTPGGGLVHPDHPVDLPGGELGGLGGVRRLEPGLRVDGDPRHPPPAALPGVCNCREVGALCHSDYIALCRTLSSN